MPKVLMKDHYLSSQKRYTVYVIIVARTLASCEGRKVINSSIGQGRAILAQSLDPLITED